MCVCERMPIEKEKSAWVLALRGRKGVLLKLRPGGALLVALRPAPCASGDAAHSESISDDKKAAIWAHCKA